MRERIEVGTAEPILAGCRFRPKRGVSGRSVGMRRTGARRRGRTRAPARRSDHGRRSMKRSSMAAVAVLGLAVAWGCRCAGRPAGPGCVPVTRDTQHLQRVVYVQYDDRPVARLQQPGPVHGGDVQRDRGVRLQPDHDQRGHVHRDGERQCDGHGRTAGVAVAGGYRLHRRHNQPGRRQRLGTNPVGWWVGRQRRLRRRRRPPQHGLPPGNGPGGGGGRGGGGGFGGPGGSGGGGVPGSGGGSYGDLDSNSSAEAAAALSTPAAAAGGRHRAGGYGLAHDKWRYDRGGRRQRRHGPRRLDAAAAARRRWGDLPPCRLRQSRRLECPERQRGNWWHIGGGGGGGGRILILANSTRTQVLSISPGAGGGGPSRFRRLRWRGGADHWLAPRTVEPGPAGHGAAGGGLRSAAAETRAGAGRGCLSPSSAADRPEPIRGTPVGPSVRHPDRRIGHPRLAEGSRLAPWLGRVIDPLPSLIWAKPWASKFLTRSCPRPARFLCLFGTERDP